MKLSKTVKLVAVSLSLALSLNPIFVSASPASSNLDDQSVTNQQVVTNDPYEEGLLEYQKSLISESQSDPQARACYEEIIK